MSKRQKYVVSEDDKLVELPYRRRLISPSHVLTTRMKQHHLPKPEFGTLPRNGNQHADSGAGSTVGTLSRLTASTYTKLKAVAAFSDKYFTNKESAEEELSFLKAVERGDLQEVRDILKANQSGGESSDEELTRGQPKNDSEGRSKNGPETQTGKPEKDDLSDDAKRAASQETIISELTEPGVNSDQTCIEMEEMPKNKSSTKAPKPNVPATHWTITKRKPRSKTPAVPVTVTTKRAANGRHRRKKDLQNTESPSTTEAAKFNRNCRDEWGRSALFIAMLHQDREMMELLLHYKVEIGECLYHAIDFGFYNVVDLFVRHHDATCQVITDEDSYYPAGLTPIQLAAHKNDYVMLKMLHAHGFSIKTNRTVNPIVRSFDGDSVKKDGSPLDKTWDASNNKILYYQAMASPAYMIMMYTEEAAGEKQEDILEKSFALYHKLKKKATEEPSARSLYIPLADKVEEFACNLLSEVRSPADLSGLLRFDPPGEERKTSQKLYLAPMQQGFEVRMKKFVAHDNCQLALSCIRQGTVFKSESGWKTLLMRIFLALLFPVLSIAFIIAPESKLGKLLRNPMVNLSSHMASEIGFLIMMDLRIILMSENTCDCLGMRPDALEWLILVWVLARIVNELKKIREDNFFQNFTNIWRLNDLATTSLFVLVIILKIVDVSINSAPDCSKPAPLSGNSSFFNCQRENWILSETWYIQISEAALSGITILIHIRALEMLYIDRTFGPLQLSLDKMILDTLRFLVLFSVTFFAFGISMTQLYWAYGKPWASRYKAGSVCGESNEKNCTHVYATVPNSLFEQYWTLFGYGYKIEPPAATSTQDSSGITPVIGQAISIIFHLWAVVVMLNMLIAMMSNSFERVRDNAEIEWKYHRSGMWMKYIRKGVYPRPPPMNLIPSPRDIRSLFNTVKLKFRKLCCLASHHPVREDFRQHSTTHAPYHKEYHQALSRITNRYMRRYLLPDFRHDDADPFSGRSQNQQGRRPPHGCSDSEAPSS